MRESQAALQEELQNQLQNKFFELFSVFKSLDKYDYTRPIESAELIWQEGSTRLFNYPAHNAQAPIVLFIPSLINRSYILDLSEKRSFLRYLQQQNIHSYLIDWGEPLNNELDFHLDDYIAGRIDKVIDRITEQHNHKIFLAGYCMGGLMATASTLRNQPKLQGLGLFATPWDFHVPEFSRFNLGNDMIQVVEQFINSSEKIAANMIQSIFYYLHPQLVSQKFNHLFSNLENSDNEEALAMEHWVNDGISMTRKVGYDCFVNWAHHNKIMGQQWQVAGQTVNPREIAIPTFLSIANKDQIVPKTSSLPLLDLIPDIYSIITDTGHISMVAGSKSEQLVWQPFSDWVKGLMPA
jgi:polyhydroxyalkanoate synthase